MTDQQSTKSDLTDDSFGVRLVRLKHEAARDCHWKTVKALEATERAFAMDVDPKYTGRYKK